MPSPLQEWELENIKGFLLPYLRIAFNDTHLTFIAELEVLPDLTHAFIITSNTRNPVNVYYSIPLEDEEVIRLEVRVLKAKIGHFQVSIKPNDLLILREHINGKVIDILNLHFTGAYLKKWAIDHESQLPKTSLRDKLAQTPLLRLFQVTGIKDDASKLSEYGRSIAAILKELANYTPAEIRPGVYEAKKVLNAIPEIGGKLQRGAVPGKGIYYDFSEYSFEKLLVYHSRRFVRIYSVEYWIQNALTHSCYEPTRYQVLQPLAKQPKNKYTMRLGIENNKDLPALLKIKIDKYPVQLKCRSLGSNNRTKGYKLTLSEDAIYFLNGYFYLRAIDLLQVKFRPEIRDTVRWQLFREQEQALVSKICLILKSEHQDEATLTSADILSWWQELTKNNYVGQDRLDAKPEIGGAVEIIRDDAQQVIGLFYTFNTLAQLILHFSFSLHFSLTPTSQEPNEGLDSEHAHAFSGSKLAKRSNPNDVNPADKRVKYADHTQSPLATCVYEEEQNGKLRPIHEPELRRFFPPAITAADLQFFKSNFKSKQMNQKQASLLTDSSATVPADDLLPPPPVATFIGGLHLSSSSIEEAPASGSLSQPSIEEAPPLAPIDSLPPMGAQPLVSIDSLPLMGAQPSAPIDSLPPMGAQPLVSIDSLPPMGAQPSASINPSSHSKSPAF